MNKWQHLERSSSLDTPQHVWENPSGSTSHGGGKATDLPPELTPYRGMMGSRGAEVGSRKWGTCLVEVWRLGAKKGRFCVCRCVCSVCVCVCV